MKNPANLLCLFLFLSGCSTPGWGQTSRSFTANGRQIDIDSLDRQINRMMADVGVPGMSFAVIDENKVVFHRGYGVREAGTNYRVNDRTVFSACSLSKSFLVYVVYQLVDAGQLDLDRPLYLYLPYKPLEHDQRYKRITARMVLSHCSGIENWGSENDTLEILADPGTKFIYSGEGYSYLALVVEHLLGQSYYQYITEREIKGLHLKNLYMRFRKRKLDPFHKLTPSNRAIGHGIFFGNFVPNHDAPSPASGNQVTAEDYAKLIIALFDNTHLSAARRRDMLHPEIRMGGADLFYGPGFELYFTGGDTIIAHGGSNPGFKALVFYSVVSKRGFVFLTNSDRGKIMANRLCELTAGLDLRNYIRNTYYLQEQYPSATVDLLKIFDEKGQRAMFAELNTRVAEKRITPATLVVLADLFGDGHEEEIAARLLTYNTLLYPDSSLSYACLGDIYSSIERYDSALNYYRKAKALNFNLWEIDEAMGLAEKKPSAEEERKEFLVRIAGDEPTMIRAVNYNEMRGVRPQPTVDVGGGSNVGFIDPGDWMDYDVDIAHGGAYKVVFRMASMVDNKLEFMAGDSIVARVDIPATKGWQRWISYPVVMQLPAGKQTLRIFATDGGFCFNWMKLALIKPNQ